MRLVRSLTVAGCMAGTLLGACSSQQLYATGQQWQRTLCQTIDDRGERQRCEHGMAASYESYQSQAESLKRP